MGQGHSTAQAGTGDPNEKGATKKDYYELLEVDQNATPEEFVPNNQTRLGSWTD